MKFSRRTILIAAIALLAVFLLMFFSAPSSPLHPGSTYSREPHGYGAWYAYMNERKARIHRWESKLNSLFAKEKGTLLRIFPTPYKAPLSVEEKKWIEAGNTLVQLGVSAPVTSANFDRGIDNPVGIVQIETARRLKLTGTQESLLGDSFGTVVRREAIGTGFSIQASTSYLAANAYQDAAGNFALLAQLVGVGEKAEIWVDEYLHGYKDKKDMQARGEGDLVSYLVKTPLLTVALQGAILLCVVIWAQNQRFGKPRVVEPVKPDNSQAYIYSLATVLVRAGASEFAIAAIGQAEKLALQRKLGLGTKLLSHSELIDAWRETGRSPSELTAVLEPLDRKQRISENQLLEWMAQWQHINQQFSL